MTIKRLEDGGIYVGGNAFTLFFWKWGMKGFSAKWDTKEPAAYQFCINQDDALFFIKTPLFGICRTTSLYRWKESETLKWKWGFWPNPKGSGYYFRYRRWEPKC